MSDSPPTLTYHHADVTPTAAVARSLVPFVVSYLVATAAVNSVAVLLFGHWNSYLGPDIELLVGAIVGVLTAAIASGVVAVVAVARRRVTGEAPAWRLPLVRAVTGIVYALATWVPGVVDTRLTGVYDVSRGDYIASGHGTTIGQACFIVGLLLLPLVLLRWSERPTE